MRTCVNLPYQVQPSGAAKYAPANKSKLVGQNFPVNLCEDYTGPMGKRQSVLGTLTTNETKTEMQIFTKGHNAELTRYNELTHS